MPDSKELTLWKDRIRQGLAAQEKYGNSKDWEQWERYYLGQYAAPLRMNYNFALARAKVPQVYYRNPRVIPVPRQMGRDAHARVLENVDDWLVQEMALKQQLKLLVLDNFIYGIGILKFGYDSEYGFKPDAALEGELGATALSSRNEDLERIEYNANIRAGMPWVLRVAPREFVLDPAALEHYSPQLSHYTPKPCLQLRLERCFP